MGEDLKPFNPKYSKAQIALLFGKQGVTDFDSWISELGPLVDSKGWNDGELILHLHPLEEMIVEQLTKLTKDVCMIIRNASASTYLLLEAAAKGLGYRNEEIKVVVNEIGPSRRLFKVDKKAGHICKVPEAIVDFKTEMVNELDTIIKDQKSVAEILPLYKENLMKYQSRLRQGRIWRAWRYYLEK